MAVEVQRTPAIGAPTITAHSRLLTEERYHSRRHEAVTFRERTNSMNTKVPLKPDTLMPALLAGVSPTTLAATGELEIAGRRYPTAARLAATLGTTVRTLSSGGDRRAGPAGAEIGVMLPAASFASAGDPRAVSVPRPRSPDSTRAAPFVDRRDDMALTLPPPAIGTA